jgi:two-component system, NtrC family, sensor histidine kinase HydH
MDIRTQSSLLAVAVSLALALAVLLRPRQGRGRSLTFFALLCLSLSAWYLTDFLQALSSREVWARLGVATGALVPFCTLTFFLQFLGMSPTWSRRARESALLGSLFGIAVAVTPLVRYPLAKAAVAVWAYGVLVVTLGLLFGRQQAASSRLDRARLLYLAIGATAVVSLSALDFLVRFGIPWPSLGGVVTTLYLFFLFQTLQRHRLLDLHELLGKVAAVSSLALMLALVYGVIGFWLKDRPGLFLFNTVIAAFVILALFEPLRAKVEEQVLSAVFRERFELIRILATLRVRLGNVISPTQMATLVLGTLAESRRVTHSSLYLLAEDQPGFRLLDSRGPAPLAFLEASSARALLGAAAAGERAVLLENVERRQLELASQGPAAEPSRESEEARRLGEVRTTMMQMNAAITFPLIGEDRVLGFWNLWDDRVAEAYSSDEIAAMLEVAERAAVVIENSQLIERMKERDRLAALGEMAAGLAHEIRNPLGAIKGAAQYLNPAYPRADDGELMQVIIEEVNRLNGVVTEFLDYSRPLKPALLPVDLNDILLRTVKLLESQGLPRGVQVKLSLEPQLGAALGDAEQLKQVFLNLALNAIQAMPKGGTLTIRSKLLPAAFRFAQVSRLGPNGGSEPPASSDGEGRTLEVRFHDTGGGIPDDARERIFIPFYTTKAKGTGLGLAICQRIVRAHGGSIAVESRPGYGTEFIVRLAAAADRPAKTPAPRPRAEAPASRRA